MNNTIEEIYDLLSVSREDRRGFPGVILADDLIRMKKGMQWLYKQARVLHESARTKN